jgi:hypothetical protein
MRNLVYLMAALFFWFVVSVGAFFIAGSSGYFDPLTITLLLLTHPLLKTLQTV